MNQKSETLTPQLKNSQQQQLISQSSVLFNNQVIGAYQQLQKAVDNMDQRVQLVMRKHQSQFLYAYRNHIKKIKKQLEQIKRKAEQQQKIFSSNDRIRYLQKQMSVFRNQAVKLYHKIQKQHLQINGLKYKVKEKQIQTQKHKTEAIKLTLIMKSRNIFENQQQNNLQTLYSEIDQYQQTISQLQGRLDKYVKRDQNWKQISEHQKSQKYLLANRKNNTSLYTKTSSSNMVYKNQLQQWFIQCIKTVKRQIHLRKKNFEILDLSNISSISEFKLVDKLRLFEIFLQNQKLLNWFYHKIFPDRMDSITKSLLITPKSQIIAFDGQYSQKQLAGIKTQRYGILQGTQLHLPNLPKLIEKNKIRNSLVMRKGGVNLSSMS